MPLSEEVLREIYSSDQSMYPAPLTYDRLQSWVKTCPELALSYCPPTKDTTKPPTVVGAAIVIPVRGKYWRDLVVGKLKEIEIDAATMISTQAGEEVGMHIFHIEKFDTWQQLGDGYDGKLRPFAEYVTADMSEIVEERGWNVLGYSGECFNLLFVSPTVLTNPQPSLLLQLVESAARGWATSQMDTKRSLYRPQKAGVRLKCFSSFQAKVILRNSLRKAMKLLINLI
jgi:hypothetical protein